MNNESDETTCPLCHQGNGCMTHSKESCWCNSVTVPQDLLDLVAEAHRGRVCICRPCIDKFNNNPVEFVVSLQK